MTRSSRLGDNPGGVVLTITGSDSSAGTGLPADLKAISANSGYGACVITALTGENTRGVTARLHLVPSSSQCRDAAAQHAGVPSVYLIRPERLRYV